MPEAVLDFDLLGWIAGVIPLATAVVFGAVVGWDRETEGRAAGLRTHMMVSLGAAGFTLTVMRMLTTVDIDPARVMGAVVGGVGFLGAGSIIKAGGRVRGLTTAAGLWVVAAIGVACGVEHYDIALFLTLLAVTTLTAVRRMEPAIRPDDPDDARHARDAPE